MTFLGVLRSMALRQGSGHSFAGLAILRHLDDDLDPALIGDPDRKKLPDGGRQGVLTPRVVRRRTLGLGCDRHGSLFRPSGQGTQSCRLGDRLVVSLAILQAIPDVSD